jgi:hypothetical protein
MLLFEDNNNVYIHIISSWYNLFGFDSNFLFVCFKALTLAMQLNGIILYQYMCRKFASISLQKNYFKKNVNLFIYLLFQRYFQGNT